jgi:hypothetical protein
MRTRGSPTLTRPSWWSRSPFAGCAGGGQSCRPADDDALRPRPPVPQPPRDLHRRGLPGRRRPLSPFDSPGDNEHRYRPLPPAMRRGPQRCYLRLRVGAARRDGDRGCCERACPVSVGERQNRLIVVGSSEVADPLTTDVAQWGYSDQTAHAPRAHGSGSNARMSEPSWFVVTWIFPPTSAARSRMDDRPTPGTHESTVDPVSRTLTSRQPC